MVAGKCETHWHDEGGVGFLDLGSQPLEISVAPPDVVVSLVVQMVRSLTLEGGRGGRKEGGGEGGRGGGRDEGEGEGGRERRKMRGRDDATEKSEGTRNHVGSSIVSRQS